MLDDNVRDELGLIAPISMMNFLRNGIVTPLASSNRHANLNWSWTSLHGPALPLQQTRQVEALRSTFYLMRVSAWWIRLISRHLP